jgi:hypothetical protein
LTYTVVANPLNQQISWNNCAVLGCNASPENHHKILSGLTWLRNRGSRRTTWGCGRRRRRRWSRGLLRHGHWNQKCHCDSQHDENTKAVAHRSMLREEASAAKILGHCSVQVKTSNSNNAAVRTLTCTHSKSINSMIWKCSDVLGPVILQFPLGVGKISSAGVLRLPIACVPMAHLSGPTSATKRLVPSMRTLSLVQTHAA